MDNNNSVSLYSRNENEISALLLRAQNAVDLVSSYVEKSYYRSLHALDVKHISEVSAEDVAGSVWLYKIDKLAYDNKDGYFAEKLGTVVSAVNMCGGTLVMLMESSGGNISLSIGVADKNRETNLLTVKDALASSFTGSFPGSSISDLGVEAIAEKLSDCFGDSFVNSCVTAISGISGKSENENFYRGMENILNSSFDSPFSLLILADPVDREHLRSVRRAYEDISTQLSKLINVSFSLQQGKSSGTNDSVTYSLGEQVTNSTSVSKGDSQTHGTTSGTTRRENTQKSNGAADVLFGAGALLSVLNGNLVGLYAMNTVRGLMADNPDYFEDTNTGVTESSTLQKSTSEGTSTGYSTGKQTSLGTNTSSSEGYSAQYTITNRAAKRLYDKIEEYLDWMDKVENYGMFNVCAYVISADAGTNMVIASQYESILRGSGIGNTYGVNTWTDEKSIQVKRYLSCFRHPELLEPDLGEIQPSVLVSSRELARHLVFPQKSVSGISIINYEAFGRNVIRRQGTGENGDIRLGCINHMGRDIPDAPVPISIDSLSGHTFVAGANSTGKSTAIFSLLNQVHKCGIPFLAIEPAKGEYRRIFGKTEGVSIFSPMLSENGVRPLKINLFWFRESVDPNEHIEKLMEVFNTCWPMYAAMPQVLREATCRAYEDCGWDLENSVNPYGRVFPTIRDVCEQVKNVIEQSEFSSEVRGNYIGSLLTRLQSLDRGIYKRVFSSGDLGDEQFFERSIVIDLSRPDASEVKALIMGALVIRLFEYCTSRGEFSENRALKHLTVLEEAHNLLAPPRTTQGEGSDIGSKAVEMITRCIAELGGFGRGFVIADQAPGLLDRSVIRNTNTKMIFRLPDMGDCELSGKSMGLRPEQYFELSRLERGVCAIHQINWEEAVLCHVNRDLPPASANTEAPPLPDENENSIKTYLKCLLLPFTVIAPKKPRASEDEIKAAADWAVGCGLSAKQRVAMIKAITSQKPEWEEAVKISDMLVDRTRIFSQAGSFDDISMWTDRAAEAVSGFADERKVMLTLIEALLDARRRAGEDKDYFHDRWFDATKAERI